MASWDSPVVSAPGTASYAAPLVNFDAIANAPKTYYAGQQMARDEEKANLFRNGIPRVGGGDTGPIDVDKVMTNMVRVGGYEYAAPLINLQGTRPTGTGRATGDRPRGKYRERRWITCFRIYNLCGSSSCTAPGATCRNYERSAIAACRKDGHGDDGSGRTGHPERSAASRF